MYLLLPRVLELLFVADHLFYLTYTGKFKIIYDVFMVGKK